MFGDLSGNFVEMDGIDWFCDNCDAQLNMQPGFTISTGKWVCTKCGYENDVTSDNILSSEEASWLHRECPKCGGHMFKAQDCIEDTWVCETCGCEATDDGYGNLLTDIE